MPLRSQGPLPSDPTSRMKSGNEKSGEDLLEGIDLVPPIDVTIEPYRLCFARTGADLEAVRRLRYAVFNVELGEGLNGAHETGLDADAFDRQCQHLMVLHVETGAVIGTYRMQTAESAAAGHGWYTSGEFELDRIPQETLTSAVELGRACVARPHRHKSVLFLLWQGLIAYHQHVGAEAFFGCSSLTGTDPRKGVALYAKLVADDKVHPTLYAPPRLALACPLLDWPQRKGSPGGADVEIPKLFASYLRNGALILGPPAIDKEFGTIDFLTWVQVKKKHLRRFGQLA